MEPDTFRVPTGDPVASVTADEMRAVDRIAVEDVGLQLLQMMENAGRTLAGHVREAGGEPVVVVAGNGGNGGGGLATARHLANADVAVRVVLDRAPDSLTGAAAQQHDVLAAMDVPVAVGPGELERGRDPGTVVDALIGYGLSGEVRDPARRLIAGVNDRPAATVSLDVPSGIDATGGAELGLAVEPDRTLTLALPKTGLAAISGRLFLADIAIPRTVYERLDIPYDNPFGGASSVELRS